VLIPVSLTRAQNNLPTSCVNSKVRYGITPLPGSTVVWRITGGSPITDYNDSIDVQWGNVGGEMSLSYREINATGCSSVEYTQKVVLSSPSVDLGIPGPICSGGSALLNAGSGFASYRWNDGSISSKLNVTTSGNYWVDVTDSVGCTAHASVTVTVNDLPVVNLGVDQELCSPNTLTLDAGNPGASYVWANNNNSSTIKDNISSTLNAEEGDGTITVAVTDANGCVGGDTINILKCIEIGTIPNAFTPNGDNKNNKWHIRQKDAEVNKYPNMIVKIYDRWGRLVFTSDRGYNVPWDGTSMGKELPMDTYYYIIDYGDGSKERTGSVAIIR
jgi:gliding motility-associated-like protein